MAELKNKLSIVTAKLFVQRAYCLARAKRLADSEPEIEAHYRGQALGIKDAIRLIDQALKND